ncbi:MAG: UDP-N-acetylmuramoyl-tripeptide--D-alanyl-D-alanine ligase, partial [bacterium]|nr:UDP-N-acetylmuramoyl-tripeptide--D-alanyl-D-alanine ligase [bacterium]
QILFPRVQRPRVSPKTLAIFVFSLLSLLVLFYLLPFSTVPTLIILDILSFFVVSLAVWLVNIPVFIYHNFVIFLSIRKFKRLRPRLVIAVSGSFGKTSTKEFLATILGQKFRVLKTDASKNSPIGIAETIEKKLTSSHEIFVVEMGAYKRGEIKKMAAMVEPDIGIITAINSQHLDLFSRIKTTMRAKYELIEGLRGARIGIINADNPFTAEMARWAEKLGVTVFSYSVRQRPSFGQRRFWAEKIKGTLEDVRFTLREDSDAYPVIVPILGAHQVGNIIASIAAAVSAGMTCNEATKACRFLRAPQKTLVRVPHDTLVLLDDSFNNNPDAAKAAIDVLAITEKRKFLVFPPMIELGVSARRSHREVGVYAGAVCDAILLTNDLYAKEFIAGATSVNKSLDIRVCTMKNAVAYLRTHVKPGDAILFKGKETARILEKIRM